MFAHHKHAYFGAMTRISKDSLCVTTHTILSCRRACNNPHIIINSDDHNSGQLLVNTEAFHDNLYKIFRGLKLLWIHGFEHL